MRQANVAMGICSGSDEVSEAFSQDILKIEVNGPDVRRHPSENRKSLMLS
jgi:hypothetical protein